MSEHKMDELLAWYVNGTLDEQERRAVEAWLEANPEAQLQLAEYEFINDAVAEEGAEELRFDTEAGLDRLLTRIEQEAAANEAVTTPPRSPLARLSEWLANQLQWGLTPAFARVAMVSQLGLVLVLGAVLLLPGQPDEGYQVLSGGQVVAPVVGVELQIGLKPEASLAELQILLRAQQAELVGGPNALGIYRIRLPEDAHTVARIQALEDAPMVTYLARVAP